ncbi:hypothetical protein [Rhodococcus pyridinivorans]
MDMQPVQPVQRNVAAGQRDEFTTAEPAKPNERMAASRRSSTSAAQMPLSAHIFSTMVTMSAASSAARRLRIAPWNTL